MIKDYARPAQRVKPRRKRMLLTVCIITLAMTIPFSLFVVKFQKTRHHKVRQTTTVIPIPQKADATTPPLKKAANSSSEFDFYTLLPEGSAHS